jgi:hypothetical protein
MVFRFYSKNGGIVTRVMYKIAFHRIVSGLECESFLRLLKDAYEIQDKPQGIDKLLSS